MKLAQLHEHFKCIITTLSVTIVKLWYEKDLMLPVHAIA